MTHSVLHSFIAKVVISKSVFKIITALLASIVDTLVCMYKLHEHVIWYDVTQRLDTVANMMQMLLWAPRHWFEGADSNNATLPDDDAISWWLTLLAAVTHCYQCHDHNLKSSSQSTVRNSLCRLFLSRVNARDIFDALSLLQICSWCYNFISALWLTLMWRNSIYRIT